MLSSAELYFIPLAVNDSMMQTYWRWTHSHDQTSMKWNFQVQDPDVAIQKKKCRKKGSS